DTGLLYLTSSSSIEYNAVSDRLEVNKDIYMNGIEISNQSSNFSIAASTDVHGNLNVVDSGSIVLNGTILGGGEDANDLGTNLLTVNGNLKVTDDIKVVGGVITLAGATISHDSSDSFFYMDNDLHIKTAELSATGSGGLGLNGTFTAIDIVSTDSLTVEGNTSLEGTLVTDGVVTFNNGTLNLNGVSILGSSSLLTINKPLYVNNSYVQIGTVTLTDNASVLSIGNSTSISGDLTVTGQVTVGSSVLAYSSDDSELSVSTATVVNNGALTVANGTLYLGLSSGASFVTLQHSSNILHVGNDTVFDTGIVTIGESVLTHVDSTSDYLDLSTDLMINGIKLEKLVSNNFHIAESTDITGNLSTTGTISLNEVVLSGSNDSSYVLQLSGNYVASGSLTSTEGTLYLTNSASLSYSATDGYATLNTDLKLNTTVITSNLSDLTIGNDVIITDSLTVQSGDLTVNGDGLFTGSLSVTGSLDIDANALSLGPLTMTAGNDGSVNYLELSHSLVVDGDYVQIGSVSGISLTDDSGVLAIDSDIRINTIDVSLDDSSLNIGSPLILGGSIDIAGSITIINTIDVSLDDSSLNIGSPLILGGSIDIAGSITMYDIVMSASNDSSFVLSIAGNVDINDDLIATNATLTSLNVTDSITLGSTAIISGELDGTTNQKTLIISDDLSVDQDAYIRRNLNISGDVVIDGVLDLGNAHLDASMAYLGLNVPITVNSLTPSITLTSTDDSIASTVLVPTINGLDINNDVFISDNSNLSVTGSFTLGSTELVYSASSLSIDNSLTITGSTFTLASVVFTDNSGTLEIAAPTTISGNVTMSNDTTVSGQLTVDDDLDLAGHILLGSNNLQLYDYGGIFTVSAPLSVGGNTTISGSIAATGTLFSLGPVANSIDLEYNGPSQLNISSDINLTVENAGLILENATIRYDTTDDVLTVDRTMIVNGVSIGEVSGGYFAIASDVSVDGNLDVDGEIYINDVTLTGTSDSTSYQLTISDNLVVSGTLNAGASTVSSFVTTGTVTINGAVLTGVDGGAGTDSLTLSGDFNASNLNITNDLSVGGDATITGDISLSGDITLDGSLSVDGISFQKYNDGSDDYMYINSDLYVNNSLKLGSNIILDGSSATLSVNSNASFAANVSVAGYVEIDEAQLSFDGGDETISFSHSAKWPTGSINVVGGTVTIGSIELGDESGVFVIDNSAGVRLESSSLKIGGSSGATLSYSSDLLSLNTSFSVEGITMAKLDSGTYSVFVIDNSAGVRLESSSLKIGGSSGATLSYSSDLLSLNTSFSVEGITMAKLDSGTYSGYLSFDSGIYGSNIVASDSITVFDSLYLGQDQDALFKRTASNTITVYDNLIVDTSLTTDYFYTDELTITGSTLTINDITLERIASAPNYLQISHNVKIDANTLTVSSGGSEDYFKLGSATITKTSGSYLDFDTDIKVNGVLLSGGGSTTLDVYGSIEIQGSYSITAPTFVLSDSGSNTITVDSSNVANFSGGISALSLETDNLSVNDIVITAPSTSLEIASAHVKIDSDQRYYIGSSVSISQEYGNTLIINATNLKLGSYTLSADNINGGFNISGNTTFNGGITMGNNETLELGSNVELTGTSSGLYINSANGMFLNSYKMNASGDSFTFYQNVSVSGDFTVSDVSVFNDNVTFNGSYMYLGSSSLYFSISGNDLSLYGTSLDLSNLSSVDASDVAMEIGSLTFGTNTITNGGYGLNIQNVTSITWGNGSSSTSTMSKTVNGIEIDDSLIVSDDLTLDASNLYITSGNYLYLGTSQIYDDSGNVTISTNAVLESFEVNDVYFDPNGSNGITVSGDLVTFADKVLFDELYVSSRLYTANTNLYLYNSGGYYLKLTWTSSLLSFQGTAGYTDLKAKSLTLVDASASTSLTVTDDALISTKYVASDEGIIISPFSSNIQAAGTTCAVGCDTPGKLFYLARENVFTDVALCLCVKTSPQGYIGLELGISTIYYASFTLDSVTD
ncbi:hypothetical protein ADUPG1_006719, partial [Aduncisulcus paluster]